LHALELYVGERTSGPIFFNADGTERLSYSTSYALIRRLAKRAGIAAASRISPHTLRHSFATELLANGVPMQEVQDAMGHADPRTTRAYDRSRATTSTATRPKRWPPSYTGQRQEYRIRSSPNQYRAMADENDDSDPICVLHDEIVADEKLKHGTKYERLAALLYSRSRTRPTR
jgi:hypothetical protein